MITLSSTRRTTTYWSVSAHGPHGTHRSTALHSPSAVRGQHNVLSAHPSTSRAAVTEHRVLHERAPFALVDLPGTGVPTPLPDLPAGAVGVRRFFGFCRELEDGSLTPFGPAALPTGDAVRRFHHWAIQNEQAHRVNRVDISALHLHVITLTQYAREIPLSALPDGPPAAAGGAGSAVTSEKF
ncbi:hypothetical protein [Streptomyces sp. NPDC004286]|uniref:hypothetical protein n=1 Tax=Streptomyces sp. NPDC004286 TaxID=3364696 RepID=UPI0036ACC10A